MQNGMWLLCKYNRACLADRRDRMAHSRVWKKKKSFQVGIGLLGLFPESIETNPHEEGKKVHHGAVKSYRASTPENFAGLRRASRRVARDSRV